MANHSISDCKRVLNPNGVYVAVAFSPVALLFGPLISKLGSQEVGTFEAKPNQKDLTLLKELSEAGDIRTGY